MTRFAVFGSFASAICSADVMAPTRDEAVKAFNAAMGDDLSRYSYGDPVVINLDDPPAYMLEGAQQSLKFLRDRFNPGRVSKSIR